MHSDAVTHDTAARCRFRSIVCGVGTTTHDLPLHDSISPPAPTAVQASAVGHDTPFKEAPKLGSDTGVQALPFHDWTTGRYLEPLKNWPTAVQSTAEVHDTP